MRAGRGNRHERPRHFVFALRATLKTGEAVGDTPLQGLVITGLKVQAVHPFQRPPVAAISDLGLARAL